MSSPIRKRLRTFFGRSTPPKAKSPNATLTDGTAKNHSPTPSPKRKTPKTTTTNPPPKNAQAYIDSLDLSDSEESVVEDKRDDPNWRTNWYEDEEYMESRCGEKIQVYEMIARSPMTIKLEKGTFKVFRGFRDFKPYRATFAKSQLRPMMNSDMYDFNFVSSRGIDIRWMLNNQKLHDVIVIVGTEQIAFLLHKVPLASSSKHLYEVFEIAAIGPISSNPQQRQTIFLPAVPVKIFSHFVEWAYGGPEDDTYTTLKDAKGCLASMQAYQLLGVDHLRDMARSYALTRILKPVRRPYRSYFDDDDDEGKEETVWHVDPQVGAKAMAQLNTLFEISTESECADYVEYATSILDGMSDAEMIAFAGGNEWMCAKLKILAPKIVKKHLLNEKNREKEERESRERRERRNKRNLAIVTSRFRQNS